jgi:hypothetical protein
MDYVFAAVIGVILPSSGVILPSPGWMCAIFLPTWPATVLIHESGHYLADAALGLRCQRFAVWPVALVHDGGHWKLRFIPKCNGGGVVQAPSAFVHFRVRHGIGTAAGRLASLLAGLVFILLFRRAHTAAFSWIWFFSIQWAIGRETGCAVSPMLQPIRPSGATNLCIAYLHFPDSGDILTAGRYMDLLMPDWTFDDSPGSALEAAYFVAFHRDDPGTARKWLASETRYASPWLGLRAGAAIQRAENQHQEVRTLVDEALATLAAQPACGSRQYEVDGLLDLEKPERQLQPQRIQQQVDSPGPLPPAP